VIFKKNIKISNDDKMMPPNYFYDKNRVRSLICALDRRSQVAFALSCVERMLPNYTAFTTEQGWGDIKPLRTAVDAAWLWLEDGQLPTDLGTLIKACDAQLPNTEDFASDYVSAALDACSSAAVLLDLIGTQESDKAVNNVIEIASSAFDTVYMYVDRTENMDVNSPDLEEKIRLHPIMQREIARQFADLQLLASIWQVSDLRRRWRSPAKSNIDL
jgi:uncharacterized protein YjaG (DUF416 family)